jgi:hypothetical protein
MHDLFNKQQQIEYPIFDEFNSLYGDALVSICNLLLKFKIDIHPIEQYKKLSSILPKIEDIDTQPYAMYIYNDSQSAETTITGIVFNDSIIQSLSLTKEEQFASIAHEIGHILYYYLENKDDYPKPQGEEIFSDKIACKIGLSASLLSVIDKLENNGWYSDILSRFGMRKMLLSFCL